MADRLTIHEYFELLYPFYRGICQHADNNGLSADIRKAAKACYVELIRALSVD